MAETQFTIGAEASCTDGVCGEVSRVVLDPVANSLTHLVVTPEHGQDKHGQEVGRLVPLEMVDATTTGEIHLRCTLQEFEKLQRAEETQFLPGTAGYAGFDARDIGVLPFYTLDAPGYGAAAAIEGDMDENVSQPVSVDLVPVGEVSVRRGDHVHATDGEIGRVQGLVIDPGSHHVTHVLLEEGHLFGRKEVAIPIGAVTGTADAIQLKLSKAEVEDLPEVGVGHPTG
jgi:sporulation protein YlmC with PRC-barrel domain